ncbi:MAG: DUF1015 domain-containing protein [Bacteroidetes bacterium]|nr:MAG: DUF1015 domain-containing protein [Bacteroidota bacterium]
MSIFVPFKAIRPSADSVESVSTKPYDVLDTEEAREESKGNPKSYYHVTKPEIDFPNGHDPFSPEVYKHGKQNLINLVKDGTMIQDNTESFYVYRLEMNGHVQTGLVGCCSIDDYFNEVIKKHETTKPHIEADRKKHVCESRVNYEAVFLSYRKVDAIDELVENLKHGKPPLYDFHSDDGVKHSLWRVEDPSIIQKITELFAAKVPTIYIADGHHRTAAGALAGRDLRKNAKNAKNRYGYIMSVLFPDDQVQIMDYNRAVKDLNGLSREEFLQRIRENFEVVKMEGRYRPVTHQNIGLYIDGSWYKLIAREGTYNPSDLVDQLSFTILSKQILAPILNIVDLRRDSRIEFIGGIRGLEELEKHVDSGKMAVAFAMHPISMAQIIHIADNHLSMPPKITWFEPKLRSGLFVHSLNGSFE